MSNRNIFCCAVAVSLAVILLLTGCSSAKATPALPAAKAFTLKMLGHPGQQISLADYAGKPVIINFFASWCTPCKRETPLLARFYRDAHGRIAIIGVDANDEAGPAERFVQTADVTYPIAFDPFPAAITTSYGVFALPQTFFLNSRHRIVKKILGDVTLTELTKSVATIQGQG